MSGGSVKANTVAGTAAKELGSAIVAKVAGHGGGDVSKAVGLEPAAQLSSRALLWRMLQTARDARSGFLVQIADRLLAGIPKVLKDSPLKLSHFGFTTLDQFVQYLVAGLATMETGARTAAEFYRGIKGWQWNLAGRLLFERMVKFHPALDGFLRGVAKDFFARIAAEARGKFLTLIDGTGAERRVTPDFGVPQKVVEFKLRGADGVVRSYTDFGFIARNSQGRWASLLIEIKLPSALAGVSEQFSQFIPRLREATELIATILDTDGTIREQLIRPEDFVFLEHEKGQIAVAPLSVKAGDKIKAAGPIGSKDVASVDSFEPAASERHQVFYYKLRLIVLRDWLVDIVRVITDPP